MASRSMPSGLGRIAQLQRAKGNLVPQFRAGTSPRVTLEDFQPDVRYSPGGSRGAVTAPYNAPGIPSTPISPMGGPRLSGIDWGSFTTGRNPGWNTRTAINLGNIFRGAATPFLGFGAIPAGWLGRGIGALVGDRPLGVQPGMGMPRFMSGGGVADLGPAGFGVAGGHAGYAGGGPDDRGAGAGASGAADPDRGGFGGENY